MTKIVWFVLALAFPASAAPSDDASALVGSWRLVSYDRVEADGRATPVYGSSPKGRLVYDAGGRMSVHLMDPRRKPFAGGDYRAGTDEELRAAFQGYFGYFGTYAVDSKAGFVTHLVEGASFPNYIGTAQQRFFVLAGDRLTLRTPPRGDPGASYTLQLVWERER